MKKKFWGVFLFVLLCGQSYGQSVTIAVFDFKVSSPSGQLDYLASGIPEMLVTDLSYQDGIIVLERERLTEILTEQGLSLAGAVDNQEAARIGKLLGVEVMVLGNLSQVGEQVRLDTHLVKVESGEAYGGQKVRGAGEANLFDLIDQLAQGIIASLQSQTLTTQADSPRIDVVFVIDSTGSMGDEINVVRTKIREIVRTVKMGYPPPDVRFAIVDYKDKGDAYLAKKFDFSRDTAAILNYLKGIAASGGGDTPESVGAGLKMALQELSWEKASNISRMMFLIGDAPPHPREKGLWKEMTKEAVDKHVSIFTIACSGMNNKGIEVFKTVARKTNGQFNFLTYKQSYVAADGSRRDVLLEGKTAYVASEPVREKEWAGGGSSFAAARDTASRRAADKYRKLADAARSEADGLMATSEEMERGLIEMEELSKDEDKPEEERKALKTKISRQKKTIEKTRARLDKKKGEVSVYTAKEKTASTKKVKKLELAAPSATPDMLASKLAAEGWKKDNNTALVNNLDAILTDVIKNEAQAKGVAYAATSTLHRPGPVLAEIRIKNRQREIWIKTSAAKVAEQFKALAEKNSKAWFGGQVIPDAAAENGFHFQPATIIIQREGKNVASLIRVTLEKISRDTEYFNKHGLMTPNRWFVFGQVIDYRAGGK